jgi:hypothetical protein
MSVPVGNNVRRRSTSREFFGNTDGVASVVVDVVVLGSREVVLFARPDGSVLGPRVVDFGPVDVVVFGPRVVAVGP